jgi:hypothetical protein
MNKVRQTLQVGDLVSLTRSGLMMTEDPISSLISVSAGALGVILDSEHKNSTRRRVLINGQSGFLFETQLSLVEKGNSDG